MSRYIMIDTVTEYTPLIVKFLGVVVIGSVLANLGLMLIPQDASLPITLLRALVLITSLSIAIVSVDRIVESNLG